MSGSGDGGTWWPLDEEVIRQVLDGTAAGAAILDTELRYRYVNPALADMNGLPA
ncbi:hypothetical protein [Actinacidiphila soli]|uniref:hypothetical protein n=1 Tax=Actinacidiphila soli TaxID=2487275 RepID=UPI0013E3AB05|nr:hypothetical protein [Actinacidiphila soli]